MHLTYLRSALSPIQPMLATAAIPQALAKKINIPANLVVLMAPKEYVNLYDFKDVMYW